MAERNHVAEATRRRRRIPQAGIFLIMEKRKNVSLLNEMLDNYWGYLEDEERSKATVEKYLRDVKAFFEFLGEGRSMTRERVREYKQELKEKLKVKLFKVQRALYCRPETELTGKDYERLVWAARRKGELMMSMLIQTMGSTGRNSI